MLIAALIVLSAMLLGAVGIIAAFFWAANNKQFENIEDGSTVIFDADEPIGERTDRFPTKNKTPKKD